MTVKRGVHIEENSAEPAGDYDANINFIVNLSLSKSQIDNEQDFYINISMHRNRFLIK
jgi:hypothetical protein